MIYRGQAGQQECLYLGTFVNLKNLSISINRQQLRVGELQPNFAPIYAAVVESKSFYIPRKFPINTNTIMIGWSIIYFKGSLVRFSK